MIVKFILMLFVGHI